MISNKATKKNTLVFPLYRHSMGYLRYCWREGCNPQHTDPSALFGVVFGRGVHRNQGYTRGRLRL